MRANPWRRRLLVFAVVCSAVTLVALVLALSDPAAGLVGIASLCLTTISAWCIYFSVALQDRRS